MSAHPHAPPPVPTVHDARPPHHVHYFKIAFCLVAAIILALVVALPFALRSLLDEVFNPIESQVFTVAGTRATGAEPERNQVHIGIVDLDESRLRVTLRVSAHRVCPGGCPTGNRVVLFSVGSDEAETAGMPPSVTIDLPAGQSVFSQSLDLPLHGHPTLYPFDDYELWLGVGLAELDASRTDRPLTRQQGQGLLAVTVQEQLPREHMEVPSPLSPSGLQDADAPYELQSLTLLRFSRPLHERVLAVLLVILIAAAAAYAVFMRPLHDLVINCGGLVLGVWGVRSLLSPGTATRTLVDISLSVVILFLLSAITFRALEFLWVRGGFRKQPQGTGTPNETSPPGA